MTAQVVLLIHGIGASTIGLCLIYALGDFKTLGPRAWTSSEIAWGTIFWPLVVVSWFGFGAARLVRRYRRWREPIARATVVDK